MPIKLLGHQAGRHEIFVKIRNQLIFRLGHVASLSRVAHTLRFMYATQTTCSDASKRGSLRSRGGALKGVHLLPTHPHLI
jgi:hypothetical protein